MMTFFRSAEALSATRRKLAFGASVMALLMAGQAHAQDQAEDAAEDQAASESDQPIIVTGSRIRSDGMQAPVPTTVVSTDSLEAAAPGPLINSISQLPQFYGNQTPNSGNFFLRSGYGSLNLRGLGVNRTLTLLNGRRMPSSSAFGGVDINLFPEAMIQSVETVTGGASAAYGSDAVAGVVNFILDTNFSGLDGSVQAGITDRNDGGNYEASLAFGTDLGERAHVMISGEYAKQEGIFSYAKRGWYDAWGTIGTGTAASPYTFYPNVVSSGATFSGIIFAPGTAINGLAFDADGNVAPFQLGATSQGAVGAPGSRTIQPGSSGEDLGFFNTVYPDLERYSVFGYADYDLTDNLKLFAQYIHGKTTTFSYNTPRGSFGGTPTAITIFQNNAFLPETLRQTMVANNIQSFTLRRMGAPEDVGAEVWLDDRTTQDIATGGLTYDFSTGGFFDGWHADAYYQYGESLRDWRQKGLRVDRIFAAADAVRDASGNIVCRVSTFAAGAAAFPNCVPINLFGRGNASPAAVDYVTGFEPGQQISTPLYFADDGFASGASTSYTTGEAKRNLTTFKQQQVELAFSGEVIDLWAGPISGAFGGSWRKESIRQIVQDVTNPASNHDTFRPVMCNNAAIGLRGVSAPDCANTVGVQFSKVSNVKGQSTVKEAFGELLVPLVNDGAFITSAAANAAVRYADYSGSGGVWAYKGGLEAEFFDALRLRGTYSRDVRAANLSERFDKTGGTATIIDPKYPGDGNVTVTRYSGGNPAVRPEVADTYTLGVVFAPPSIPGLSASVDWYDVKLKGAISQVGNQEVANRCFANDPTFCALVTRDPNTDRIILIGDVFVNVAQARVSGIDAEVSYTMPVTLFGGDETLGTRVFASWLTERSETDFSGFTIDYAGQTGARQSDGVYFPYPDFKATGSFTYKGDAFSTLLQLRYIGKGIQDVTPDFTRPGANPVFVADNTVDSAFYVDLRLGYEFNVGSSEAEFFVNVTNLFDEAPPVTPAYTAFLAYPTQVNTAVYDVLGRRYTAGVKFKL